MPRNDRVKNEEFGPATVAGHTLEGKLVLCCDDSGDPDLFTIVDPDAVEPLSQPKDLIANKNNQIEALKLELSQEKADIWNNGIDNFKKAIAAAIQSLKNSWAAAGRTKQYIKSNIKDISAAVDSLVVEYNSGRRF